MSWFASANEEARTDDGVIDDPNAVVAVLGEIGRQGGAPTERDQGEDLPPLDLDHANLDELRRRDD
jgi:hypothetical protein